VSECGAVSPLPDAPPCQMPEGHEPPHRAWWPEYGGVSSLDWQDAQAIREALRPQAAVTEWVICKECEAHVSWCDHPETHTHTVWVEGG
jgi:hypothetical protein